MRRILSVSSAILSVSATRKRCLKSGATTCSATSAERAGVGSKITGLRSASASHRNAFRIDDAASWCDYIDMLGRLGKDIHNAHYVCPSDFRQAHDRCHALLARIEAEEQVARRRAEYLEYEEQYRKAKGRYLGIAFSDGEIEVRVLQSVQEFIEEGKAMHHCVERYHDKSDSLILSARIADRRVETVEVSLSRLQVVQSRGACNRNTEYHDRIVRLVNDNMSLVRAARHKRDKAPRIATLGRAASDRLKVSA